MTRQIILDTETTGLEPREGHRIIEIGAIELVNRRFTQKHLHFYLNPEREVESEALSVHGLNNAFLKDKPKFSEVASEFLAFIEGAELVIHNAPFDLGFLEHELKLMQSEVKKLSKICRILDTLVLARKLHPGQKNSLDALCKRYKVDAQDRTLHGALLDAQILGRVYLAMTGGQSTLLGDELAHSPEREVQLSEERESAPKGFDHAVYEASAEEQAAHADFLKLLDKKAGGKTLWKITD